jgi:hypothetical protein
MKIIFVLILFKIAFLLRAGVSERGEIKIGLLFARAAVKNKRHFFIEVDRAKQLLTQKKNNRL